MIYPRITFARSLDTLIDLANTYVFHWDLEKIIEVTYSYRDLDNGWLLNETLFEEYLSASYPEYSLEYLSRKYQYKIQVQIILIDNILRRTHKIKVQSRSQSLKRGIFIDALEYVKNILEISLLWVVFELEKAGKHHNLTKRQIEKRIKDIEAKEAQVFGRKVIAFPQEFSFCYNFIVKNHEAKKKKLSQKDKKIMKKALANIKQWFSGEILETQPIVTKYSKGKFLKKEILRKDYRKIFDDICEMYGLPQRTKITNAWSIYDGDHFLEIPRSQTHATMTVDRLLRLISHEIESHYINAYNGRILLWKFRGAKNLPKEEWLAKFMEKIWSWYTHENIDDITEGFFTMIAGETLWWEELSDFMRIMGKEYKCQNNYQAGIIRAKRNYSFMFPWVQHKDVVYFRWLTQTVAYLKQWGSFWKLFLGKVGFNDIENLYDIYVLSDRKHDLVFPIFISDLIYYYIKEKQKNKEFLFSAPDYYLYLKKKYWFLDLESFHIIDHVDSQWKKIEKIIKKFENVIE